MATITKIQDTARILAGKGIAPDANPISIEDAYFGPSGGNAWTALGASSTFPVKAGDLVKLSGVPGVEVPVTINLVLPQPFAVGATVGVVVDFEATPDTDLYIYLADARPGVTQQVIKTGSGRYVVLFDAAVYAVTQFRLSAYSTTNPNAAIYIKECFAFNAGYYSYKDFLLDPVAEIITTWNQTPMQGRAIPVIGADTAAPVSGNWVVGDRIENIAWDGQFSTPIAWVCTVAGSPGAWKAVSMFDMANANRDPYFNSYITGVWTKVGPGPNATYSITPGRLTISTNTDSYAGAQDTNVPCVVPYEIVTVTATCVQLLTASCVVRLGETAGSDVQFVSASTQSVDRTLPSSLTTQKSVAIYAQNPSDTVIFSSVIVRPKYPFLSKAPQAFTAQPPQAAIATNQVKDTWYRATAGVTYSGGAISFAAFTDYMWYGLPVALKKGKTYRARVNITAVTATGLSLRIYNASTSHSININLPASTGIKEVTFTPDYDDYAYIVVQPNNTGDTGSINYIRLYSE